MVFEISTAKREILQKLVQQDWTPTDLAQDLGKSTSAVYNHLDDLAEQGILVTTQVAAKTRPKTEYSIGPGFMQSVTVLPGQYQERVLGLSPHKEAIIRIWNLPQDAFHPFLEAFWWRLRTAPDIDLETDVTALAVYGSVARGDADADSDIDILAIVADDEAEASINQAVGTVRLDIPEGSKIAITELFTRDDYRQSVAHGSSFLENVQDELHVLYDPDRILTRTPENPPRPSPDMEQVEAEASVDEQ